MHRIDDDDDDDDDHYASSSVRCADAKASTLLLGLGVSFGLVDFF